MSSLLDGLSVDQISALVKKAPASEKVQLLALIEELHTRKTRELAQDDFLEYVNAVWPDFISGAHHRRIAKIFEAVARGEKKRVIINLGPRHTKSEFASYLLPSWILGKFPKKKVMQISNTAELAEGFGRKVRNLVDSDSYKRIFPDVELRSDSKAAGRWNTNANGEYFASGVGGTVTGRGADLLIIDDPHSEGEAVLAQFNPDIYDKVYEWYTSGPRQRLQPGGAIVIVMCMTGDTLVLMADGAEKPLRDLRPDDVVATFEDGKLTTAKVNNHQSSGVDSIYKIQTQSGRILRANERHPFLVMNYGVLEWTRLRDLRPGDQLVSLKGAADLQEQKQSPECAKPANQKRATTEKTPTRRDEKSDITESTRVNCALRKAAKKLFTAGDSAKTTTLKNTGLKATEEEQRSRVERCVSNLVTELPPNSTTLWLKSAATDVMCAGKSLLSKIQERIGTESSASTITMTLEEFEVCCATIAISRLDTERRRMYSNELQHISDFTLDTILTIIPDGEEEVFDVEIDRTENFIANGVVSHNTRWSLRDLTGQVLDASAARGGDKWEVIEFPAILPSGKPLWPEFWKFEELDAIRKELSNGKWMAQYQQQPTSEANAIIKREWWMEWEKKDPPKVDFIIMSMDTAFEKKTSADYSAAVIFGVWENPDDDMQPNLILLEAWRGRLEFPELKAKTLELYEEWEPDSVIIEKKASGAPLIYELRRMGIPAQEFTPSKGNDKITRLNAISDIFSSGKVWAPQTRWAEELIDEVASFPAGKHDDFVDATSLALARFRSGGFIGTAKDKDYDSEDWMFRAKKAQYY